MSTFVESDYECEICDKELPDVEWRDAKSPEESGYYCDACWMVRQ